MLRFKWIATALTFTLLALPGLALGQGAAGDQYTEQIPTAGPGGDTGGGTGDVDGSASGTSGGTSGGTDTSTGSTGSDGGNGGPLGSSTVDEFNKDKDGAAAAGLANQTAPDSQALNDAAAQAQSGTSGESTSVFDAPGDTSSSDDGMGIALPIILGIVLLGGIAFAWWRRRGDSGGTGSPKSSPSLRDRLPGLSSRG